MGQVERAVHMSGALSASAGPSPSLLETECAGRLDDALYPGLRHVLRWLAECRPQLAPLATCADELHLLLSTFVHYHHLHEKAGSFGECFYGLKRERASDSGQTELDEKHKLSSLLWLTAVPYLCLKFQQKLTAYRLQLADGVLFNVWERRLKQLVCLLGGLGRAGAACWRVAELSGGTVPALRVQGLRLRPAGSEQSIEPAVAVQAIAFGAQLASSTAAASSTGLPSAAAPPPPAYHARAGTLDGACPLCTRRPPVSPTAVATSGYVFCFSCIVHHVQVAHDARCPVTSLPISLQHLVRIYLPHSN